ncbi:MipA/OmpV family protein [Sphingobium sp. BYY-5]|uniref:MipA/OmpV family protein n=1 Tax=Sphingobium sp. BYY-5 TaxID=2926400 RepID=UPI001FA7A065|nr:MipA/OmpV family protein [Sphingobium sp. BYY-5]MCI4589464.1 MipA/OmpV family protein [Sphingobium sp. BYY-5]
MMSSIELTVIALSRHDPLSSLKPPGSRSFSLFGSQAHLPLANPRLEALRRYAVLLRLRGHGLAQTEHERIRNAGYDPCQIDAIARLVAPTCPPPSIARSRRQREATMADRLNGYDLEQENRLSQPMSTVSCRPKLARIFMLYLVKSCPRLLAVVPVLSLICWGASAQAQDKDHIIIGLGAAYTPAYQGADDYRLMPLPAIDIAWGPVFANLRNGIGINAIDNDVITAGASVTFMQGYRRRDAPEGIGRLSVGAGGRLFVNLKAGGFIATLGATKGFAGGTKGVIADASLSYPIMLSSRLVLVPTIGTTWADKKHNDRYFGVDAEQSLASGLPQFRAGSGFKDASAMVSAQYRLTDRISLGASAGVTTLLGKVQDSPIVFHKTQPLGFLSLSYRFGS